MIKKVGPAGVPENGTPETEGGVRYDKSGLFLTDSF